MSKPLQRHFFRRRKTNKDGIYDGIAECHRRFPWLLQISMGDNSFFPWEAGSWICYVVFTRLCSMTWK